MSRQRIYLPLDSYVQMAEDPQSAKMAAAFLSYAVDKELGIYRAVRHYAEMWAVSIGTAHKWMREFSRVIETADGSDY